MSDTPKNETRERIFDTAEQLFMARGYSSVKLRDIADAVGMRHASLYYYVPKGKEQLFIEVIKRAFNRHYIELNRAIDGAGDDLRAQIYAVSDWFVSQPPIDLVRMFEADLPALDPAVAGELNGLVFNALTIPLNNTLLDAKKRGVVGLTEEEVMMASMSLITLLQGVHHIPSADVGESREAFAHKVCDLILNGLLTR